MLWHAILTDNSTMRILSIVSAAKLEQVTTRAMGWYAIHDRTDTSLDKIRRLLADCQEVDCGLVTIHILQGEQVS